MCFSPVRRLSLLVLLAVAIAWICPPCRGADTPIRVGYSYWLPNVPLEVASARGWWKERGLDVTLKAYPTTQDELKAFRAGEIDLASEMIGSWIDCANRGDNLVILGETDWSHGGDKIVAKEGVSLAAHRGNVIGVYINNLALQHFLYTYLESTHLTLADFSLVEIADDAKATDLFVAGKVRVMMSYDPIASTMVEKGAGRVLATTADFPGVMPEGFAARRDFVDHTDRAALTAFFRVWFRAVAHTLDAKNHPEVAQLASEKVFAGTATYKAEDMPAELAKTPLHLPATAPQDNGPDGNLLHFAQKARITLIKSGRHREGFDPVKVLRTDAILAAAQAEAGVALASASAR